MATNALDGTATREMMIAVSRRMIDSVDLLTDADRAIGDGDHGIGMRRGFEAALDALEKQDDTASPDAVMKAVGMAIMGKTGGAAGAVFGTLFRSGGKALEGRDLLDGAGFAAFLQAAVEAVMKRGQVSEGQKTMVDALAPAARAAATTADRPLGEVLVIVAEAADGGVQATRDMVATTGKARSLGERSLGHVDPGAVSVSIILASMRDYAEGG
jgi:dihydroxyacetone kinase-like protein